MNQRQPQKLINKSVSSLTVGKYYLKVELSKLFVSEGLRSGIGQTIDELAEYDFWRLLEAMSFTYRLNGIFWTVSNDKYSWSEEEWSAGDVEFVRMRPEIDKITFSPQINGNPLNFRNYLQNYFVKHPHSNDDPEHLNQFRPTNKPIPYPKLFLIEKDNKIKLLDGGNRLIANLLNRQETFTAFIARETNPNGKPMIGDSTFWLLGRIYATATNDEEKEAIFKTIKILINNSRDGAGAVKTYWLPDIEDSNLNERLNSLLNQK